MKTPTPKHDSNHGHKAAHFITGCAVVAAGAVSTIIATYVLSRAALPPDVRVAAMVAGSVLVASLALMPMFLAPAYGDALRTGKARGQLLLLTLMVLAVDGAMQLQSVSVIAKALGHEHVNHWAAGAVIALFQAATFFIRGSLIEAYNERKAADMAAAIELEKLVQKREKNKARRARARRAKQKPATGLKMVAKSGTP